MRTSAPTQPFQTEPTSNSHSDIRNQLMPCSAAVADETTAKHLFKLSHDVILSLDRIGKILCINHRGVELSGYQNRNCAEPTFLNSCSFPRTGSLLVKCSRIC